MPERSWLSRFAENAQQQLALKKRDQEIVKMLLYSLSESKGDPEKANWYLKRELKKRRNFNLELSHESSKQVMANPYISERLCTAMRNIHGDKVKGFSDQRVAERVGIMLSSVFSVGNDPYHRED